MNRKVFVVVVSSLILGASSRSLGVFAAAPIKAAGESGDSATESHIRESIGLPARPTSARTVEVGPLTLSASEAETFARFGKMKEQAQELSWLVLGDPTVISYVYDTNISKPAVTIWTSNDGPSPSLPDYMKQLSQLGFSVVVKSVPYSKGDYLAVRNASSRELFGIATDVDINPRVKQRIELTDENLAAGEAAVELIRNLRSKGFGVYDTYLPSDEPIVELVMSAEGLKDSASTDLSKLNGTMVLKKGSPAVATQAGGPWPGSGTTWSGRLLIEANARGGKRFSGSGSCTSGPVVRSQYGTDYIFSAGHCYDGQYGTTPTPSGTTSGVAVAIFASCNVSNVPTCSPNTYGGVDTSVWSITSGGATGWFVHQGPPPPPYLSSVQGTAYTDATLGSLDLNAGDPLVCIEGASVNKYGGSSNLNAISSCGVAGGWSGAGYQYLNMYPGNGICHGDSGAYVRNPSGGSGSYNAGNFRGVASTSIPEIGGCWVRVGNSAPALPAQITTFYKAHLWLHNLTGGVSVWSKTW